MPVNTWSVVTVTFNSAATLRRFWDAERPQVVEWIVVDNGSTDDSVAAARGLGAQVIEVGRNIGFAAANNLGLNASTGEYVAFMNPDVRGEWADLDHLAASVEACGGLVSPQLLNDDGSLQPNGRGAPMLASKVRHRLAPRRQTDGYQVVADGGVRKYVFWLMGAVVMGRADTIRALGGWNERFFLYYEDKDLSLRAWRAGVPVVLDGNARWNHGWARETKKFRLSPWVREVDSLLRFYSLYPEFLLTPRLVRHRHERPSKVSGQIVGTA